MIGQARRARSPARMALFACLAAVAGWFALLFALANDDWTVIRMPTMPGNPAPSVAAFEARLYAVMLASLSAGALIASFAWWRARSRLARRCAAESARAKRMESELAVLGRLVSTTRDLERTAADSGGRNGREP